MVLKSQKIKLLPFNDSDKRLFVEISMCPQMMKHVRAPFTYKEAVAAFYDKSKPWSMGSSHWVSFGVTELQTNSKIGSIGLKITDHKNKIAEVGFMIKPSAQGKGYAGEALDLIIGYATEALHLKKLTAICSVNNTASYGLLEKLNFVQEKHLKNNVLINEKWVDDYVYGLCLNE